MKNLFPRMHVSFYVSDINKSVNFYTKFFGLEPVKVKPAYAKYILEKPSLIISFVENKQRVHANFGHVGFQVETLQELNERLAEAQKKNLVALQETEANCCYAKQDKFWVQDPDGVQWEVYYFHADADFNDAHYAMDEATVCCTVSTADVKSSCGCNATVSETVEKAACC
jgi:catechol 2,3-dioxygenase-like lactoylglutathione lyase family enzyme